MLDRRRSGLLLFVAALVAIAFSSACSADPGTADGTTNPKESAPTEELGSVGEELSSVDCSEHTETGYSSGNPFPINVVTVDGKMVERDTANAYYVMAQAAAADGVNLQVISGFRTMAQQEYLYGCYVNCSCNNCNLAAKPGYSNHQSGHALDLNTSAGGVYAWLEAHAGAFGFKRTVPSEAWHWEWWGGGPGGGPCNNCAAACGNFGCACVDGQCNGGYCPGTGCSAEDTKNCAAFGCGCVDGKCNGGYCEGSGCTAKETLDCGQFGCGCVDHQCSGGIGCSDKGNGCTAKENDDCSKFGCGCSMHKCSGGACKPPAGSGCSDDDTKNCGAFGCGCVDGQCSGGACEGSGCSADEEKECEAKGCGCADHTCGGGSCQGTGCTSKQSEDCSADGKKCALGACVTAATEPSGTGGGDGQPPDPDEPNWPSGVGGGGGTGGKTGGKPIASGASSGGGTTPADEGCSMSARREPSPFALIAGLVAVGCALRRRRLRVWAHVLRK